MKSLSIVLAVSGALAIPRGQPSDEIAQKAKDICGRAENIDTRRCERDTDNCIREALANEKCKTGTKECMAKALAFEEDETDLRLYNWVLWNNVRRCGLLKQIQEENMTAKNFVALNDNGTSKITCQKDGNVFHCDEWTQSNPNICSSEDKNCLPLNKLPELCAKEGGCKRCESTQQNRFPGTPNEITCELVN